MEQWPASLPQNQFIGVTTEDDDSVLRTQMDAGPVTRRNRYTSYRVLVTTPITLTGVQKITFDNFFRQTLANGALSFLWSDPTTDSQMKFTFVRPPKLTMIRGAPNPENRVWQGELQLEVRP